MGAKEWVKLQFDFSFHTSILTMGKTRDWQQNIKCIVIQIFIERK